MNTTIAFRMLFLVRLYFLLIWIEHLDNVIHLQSPWETKEKWKKKEINKYNHTWHTLENVIKLVLKACHHSLEHNVGTNNILRKLQANFVNFFGKKWLNLVSRHTFSTKKEYYVHLLSKIFAFDILLPDFSMGMFFGCYLCLETRI